jgi:hypothetical protein
MLILAQFIPKSREKNIARLAFVSCFKIDYDFSTFNFERSLFYLSPLIGEKGDKEGKRKGGKEIQVYDNYTLAQWKSKIQMGNIFVFVYTCGFSPSS